MSDVDFVLDVLIAQVEANGSPDLDYVVFGSTVLWLHRLRDEVGDVDVFVRPHVFEAWRQQGWRVLDPSPPDPAFLELDLAPDPPIHAFRAWTPRDEWMDVERCFELAEVVLGVRCVPLDEVARHKELAHRDHPDSARHEKHLADLRLLRDR